MINFVVFIVNPDESKSPVHVVDSLEEALVFIDSRSQYELFSVEKVSELGSEVLDISR